jgi:hypothetical protein
MATNPLGLQRSGDLQTDLDLIFANLQYLRDSLPQTTALTSNVFHSSGAGFTPISKELSFPISSRVFFEAYILMDAYLSEVPSASLLAMRGPAAANIAYRVESGGTFTGWDRSSNVSNFYFYRIQGMCEPSVPGLLQVTLQGTRTVFRTSHLTVSLL